MKGVNNPLLRKKGEQIPYTQDMIGEMTRCAEDIVYFAENYFWIINVDEGEQKIKLHDYQKKVLLGLSDESDPKRRHKILLSPRQIGKTTLITIVVIHYILFNDTKKVAVMGNKEDTSKEILERIKFAYEKLPRWMQQGVEDDGWNQKSIRLENKSQVITAATSSSGLRSKSINLVILDEFAHIRDDLAEQFVASTYPVISSGKTTRIFMLSTPKGLNSFYDFWKSATRKENNFKALKVNYWEVPSYSDPEFKTQMISDIGLTRFNQEYGNTFLGSSDTLVPADVIERIVVKDPISTKYGSLLQIWEEPKEDGYYVLGIDPSQGIGKNYSVIQILRINDPKNVIQVGMYRSNTTSISDFAQICISISKYYNQAYMMIENNGEAGGVLCHTIWEEHEYDYIANFDAKRLGINSNKGTKFRANDLLRDYLCDGYLTVYAREFLHELARYEEKTPGVFKAAKKNDNDDTVTAMLWAIYFLDTPYYANFDNKKDILDEYKLEENVPAVVFDEMGGLEKILEDDSYTGYNFERDSLIDKYSIF